MKKDVDKWERAGIFSGVMNSNTTKNMKIQITRKCACVKWGKPEWNRLLCDTSLKASNPESVKRWDASTNRFIESGLGTQSRAICLNLAKKQAA